MIADDPIGSVIAVHDELVRRGAECDIADPADFLPGNTPEKTKSGIIRRTHKRLMGVIRKAGDLIDRAIGTAESDFSSAEYAQKLGGFVKSGGYDSLVAVGQTAVTAASALRRHDILKIPSAAVMTDYDGDRYVTEALLDKYCMPFRNPELKAKLAGASATVTGIPVPALFGAGFNRETARNYLVIPKKKQIYMLNSSGIGRKMISEMCERLTAPGGDCTVYIAARRDDETFERLQADHSGNPRVQVIAYTQKINVYLKAADVVFAKPVGGISTAVALLGVPLIHMSVSDDTEKANAEFFSKHEMAVTARSAKDAVTKACRFVSENALALRIKTMQKKYSFPDSAERTAAVIMGS